MQHVMVRYKVKPDRAAETRSSCVPSSEVGAFRRFQRNIGDRCDKAPVAAQPGEIGSFRLFDG
jgi:hypothetical protein